jgi:catechol 2,3-dioxygenase-like lactoylglutathione lyase family enzyme
VIKALNELEVITLFVEDLPATKTFYTDVFGQEVIYEDDESAVIKLKNVLINLLLTSEAHGLIAPASVAAADAGARALLTIHVNDADAVVAELEQHGVKLINGPVDQPWGRRTAAFADPAGNVWEIAQELSGNDTALMKELPSHR